MVSRIESEATVVGPRWPTVERFQDDPGIWLPPPATAAAEGGWWATLYGGPATIGAVVWVGPVRTMPDRHSRHITWHVPAAGPVEKLLPSFSGQLSLRYTQELAREGTLLLRGHYIPPLGRVGQAIDDAALHRVAQATIDTFVREVAESLVDTRVLVG